MTVSAAQWSTSGARTPTSAPSDINQAEPISCPVRRAAVSICKGIGVKEIAVTEEDRADHAAAHGAPNWGERLGRIGVDWWATIVAGVVVLLAVAGLLPKIPW